jgi:signal transduction histidine kinase
MKLSIRSRLTLWYTAVLCTVLFAFGGGVVFVQQRFGRAQFDSELEAISRTTVGVLGAQLKQHHDLRSAATETKNSVDIPARTVAILDVHGERLAAHWRGFRASLLPVPLSKAARFFTVRDGDNTWRVHVVKQGWQDTPYYVVAAGTTEEIARERTLLIRALTVATPLAVLFAAAVCWSVASRAMRPVTEMAAEAESITAQATDARLSDRGTGDELQQLAHTFNRLLHRLATALKAQRLFMADASHELRTPISIAKTACDVTLSASHRDELEYRDALAVVSEQTDRLRCIVEDLFVLARADAGGYPLRPERIGLDEVIADTVDGMGLLAESHGVRLNVDLPMEVYAVCDEQLVRRLVTNLLDNAIKHSDDGGCVRVTLTQTANTATIAVIDQGRGVPPEDQQRIFERFVRLQPGKAGPSGAGLGLPIGRWIAELHGGSLTLDPSFGPGSRFVVQLPVDFRGEGPSA